MKSSYLHFLFTRLFMQDIFLKNGKFWIVASVLIIIIGIILLSKKVERTVLLIDHVTIEKIEDIKIIRDTLVEPVLYSSVQILDKLDNEERKKRFIDVLLPTILIYRHQLAQNRESVKLLKEKVRYGHKWSGPDSLFVNDLYENYKTRNFDELIRRMVPPPVSLALAQAAIESGWGSSRFFKDANNIFGVWSFSESDDRIVASQTREGEPIYLKKYENLLGSVENYHLVLARGEVYSDFRECIHRDNNVFELIWYLRNYSEKRDQYVIMLRNIIAANDLTKYDRYRIDPEYLVYPSEAKPVL